MATSFTTKVDHVTTVTAADINLIQTAVNTLENAPSGAVPYPSQLRSATSMATMPLNGQMTAASVPNMVSGTIYFTFFTAPVSITTTQIRYIVQGAATSSAAGTSIGLYSVDASDNGTLIASVASTTLFTGTGAATASWAASAAITAGGRYAVGFLNIAGVTQPLLLGASGSLGGFTAELAVTPRICSSRTGQSAQGNFTVGSLTGNAVVAYAVIL